MSFGLLNKKNGASEDSLYRIKFTGKYLIEACSDIEVGTINHGTARKCFNRLDSLNLKFTSKQTYASVAIAAFNLAVKQGFVKTNYFVGKIALASKDEVVLAKEPFSVEEMKLGLSWSTIQLKVVLVIDANPHQTIIGLLI